MPTSVSQSMDLIATMSSCENSGSVVAGASTVDGVAIVAGGDVEAGRVAAGGLLLSSTTSWSTTTPTAMLAVIAAATASNERRERPRSSRVAGSGSAQSGTSTSMS